MCAIITSLGKRFQNRLLNNIANGSANGAAIKQNHKSKSWNARLLLHLDLLISPKRILVIRCSG